MLNANKLKAKIVEKGMPIIQVCKILNIAPSTFYRKLKNNSFEIGEVDKIVRVLSLSFEEATSIFFEQFVA